MKQQNKSAKLVSKFEKRVVFGPIRPPLFKKKKKFPWVLLATALFCIWFVSKSLSVPLPEPFNPPILYSNQCQHDIRSIFLKAIRNCRSSIHLVMFGLSDPSILTALSQKIEKKIPTSIYYDPGGSAKIEQQLQGSKLHPIKNKGLMHQKILILDQETVFIGSANMTSSSLRMHDNLIVGFASRPIAQFLQGHEPYTPGYFNSFVGGQKIELWLLPDRQGHAISALRKKIREAARSIRIAMFTFTHPHLVDEVIEAHERGVAVSIVVDMHSGLGASGKAIEALKKAKVPVQLSRGPQLLHHKFIYIDEQILMAGSANWTKAAFYKNSDCILALYPLNQEQKRFMNRLWNSIEKSGSKS